MEPNLLNKTLRNLLAFALFSIITFALVQITVRITDGWAPSALADVAGSIIGAYIAFRMRATLVFYLTIGFTAYLAATFVIHAVMGIRAGQGADYHFGALGAAIFGVALAVFLTRSYQRRLTV